MLFFLNFPEETRKLLGPGTLVEGALTGTYSTPPSATTLEILTPDRDVEPSDDPDPPPSTALVSPSTTSADQEPRSHTHRRQLPPENET